VEKKLWDPLEAILCGPREDSNPAKKAGQSPPTDKEPGSPRKGGGGGGGNWAEAAASAPAVLAPALPQRTALPAELVAPLVEKCYASGEVRAISIGIRATELHGLSPRLLEEVGELRFPHRANLSNLKLTRQGLRLRKIMRIQNFVKTGKWQLAAQVSMMIDICI
jgi:hypothetical protein